MACFYCGGNHSSDYCTGYNTSSMALSLEDVTGGIEALSDLNESALQRMDAMIEEQVAASDSIEQASDEMAGSLYNLSRVEERGFGQVSATMQRGFTELSTSILNTGMIVSMGLIGIGAVLLYRERMDQLRHQERLRLDEEMSDAGKARRELTTATALLTTGEQIEASRHLERSLILFPASAETFRIRSIIESQNEQSDKAMGSLKTALELLHKGAIIPCVLKMDSLDYVQLYLASYISCHAQLAQELSITGKEEDGLYYLEKAIQNCPGSADLNLLRIRILSKTKRWPEEFESAISRLIRLSPTHFNILFLDQQLGERKSDVQLFLNSQRDQIWSSVYNKNRVLMVLSKGEFKREQTLEQVEKMSYVSLWEVLNQLNFEIAQRRKFQS